VPLGLAPAAIGLGGPVYLASAALVGAWLLVESVLVFFERDEANEPAAHRLFKVTLLYMFMLFASLIVERLAGIAPFGAWT